MAFAVSVGAVIAAVAALVVLALLPARADARRAEG
jgi:archaellum component FlaF (FlaF/FlaG flagellin family)